MITPITVKCRLIGICGHAGAGKDTVAHYIHETHDNTWKLSFAEPLKAAAAEMFGIPVDHFYDPDFKEVPDPFWGVSPRKIAQFFGTEMVRGTIHDLIPEVASHFWISRMIHKLTGQGEQVEYDEDDVVIISDVRFQNEYDWIISQGGIIIHLTRPGADGTVGIPGHASEAGIHFHAPEQTYLIHNNLTLEFLYEEVGKIITHANIYPFSNPESF
jgi:hypothetical protein